MHEKGHIMLSDLLTQKCARKKVTDYKYPRACRFRKHQIKNVPGLKIHKMWLKLAKID
jgi:hypothetical protein